jgi:hypothetical protein
MLAIRCACGFERLHDEQVVDHLLVTFEPEDSTGTDGLIHLEMARRACSCGFQAASADDLDHHFLVVFTPADQVGPDGHHHEPVSPACRVGAATR